LQGLTLPESVTDGPPGPFGCIDALPIPPSRSLVPLVIELQGLTLPESVTDGPPGPFGCIDALPIPPSRSAGLCQACAREANRQGGGEKQVFHDTPPCCCSGDGQPR
jgi:hypothetical protein